MQATTQIVEPNVEQPISTITENKQLEDEIMSSDEDAEEALNQIDEQFVSEQLLRSTPEYRMFVELEFFKMQEKKRFKRALKEKEAEYLHQMRLEFEKQQENARNVMKQKTEKIDKMEQDLKKSVAEMEQKKKKIDEAEKDFQRRKQELESDYQRKVEEMEHIIKMTKEECAHKVALEQQKIQELEKERKGFQDRLNQLQQQNQKLIDDFHEYHRKVSTTDSVQLQSEIQRLQIENQRLNKELQEAIKAKKVYKAEWKKTVEQMNRLKRNHEEQIQKMLNKERQEIMELKRLLIPTRPPEGPQQQLCQMQPQKCTQEKEEKHWVELEDLKKTLTKILNQHKHKHDESDDTHSVSTVSSSTEEDIETRRKLKQRGSIQSSTETRRSPLNPRARQWYEKQKLYRLKKNQIEPVSPQTDDKAESNKGAVNEQQKKYVQDNSPRAQEIKRLLREKAQLLQSGVYAESSDIIKEITDKIKKLNS